jgi:uncharacterized protein involved in exopolysaccharide biosynthesis
MSDYDQDERSGGLPSFLFDPIGVVRRRYHWMLPVLGLGAVLAAALVSVWPMTYVASARALLSGQRLPEDFVRTTVAEGFAEQLNAMVGQALSRESLSDLVEKHGLAAGMSPDEQVEVLGLVRTSIAIEQDRSIDTGRESESTYIFSVGFRWDDPQKAAAVANDLVGKLISANEERRGRQARVATDFLRKDAERAEASLREWSKKITEFKEKYRGELPSELETKSARLERLQAQRQALGLQISEAESRLMLLRTQGGDADPRAKSLAALEERLFHERSINTDEHPNVTALQRQIEALRAEMRANPEGGSWSPMQQASIAAVQREVGSLRSQLSQLEVEMAELEVQVAKTPARQEELTALTQREEVLRESYADSLKKVKEAELSESLEASQQGIKLSRLGPAVPPLEPEIPRWVLALVSAAGVLAAAVALALALEFFDPVVLARSDVETLTGLPALGELPRAR